MIPNQEVEIGIEVEIEVEVEAEAEAEVEGRVVFEEIVIMEEMRDAIEEERRIKVIKVILDNFYQIN